jgi:cytochrome c2
MSSPTFSQMIHFRKNNSLCALLLIVVLFSFFSSTALSQTHDKKEVFTQIDLESKAILGKLNELEVKKFLVSHDPVYHRNSLAFEGYRFKDILKILGNPKQIKITAKDGYQVKLTMKGLPLEKAALVFREANLPNNKKWNSFEQGKVKITPEPFMLIWTGMKSEAESNMYQWPYQIVRIEVDDELKYEEAWNPYFDAEDKMPKDQSIIRGYKLYKHDCSKCHSINTIGGEFGPELNVPKNITEYRDIKVLKDFIRDPSSFRWKSKMPSYNHLSETDILDLLKYFTHMKGKKRNLLE